MKLLVTGASGFIGSHLLRHAIRAGWDVHVLLRQGSALPSDLQAGFTIHLLEGKPKELNDIVASVAPEVVVHLASKYITDHRTDDLTTLVESNLLFPLQLLDAMTLAGVKQLVNTGTSWQHYHSHGYLPANLYAATKQAFEDLLTYYVDACQMQVVTLKLFDTYGPRDRRGKVLSALVRAARDGTTLDLSPGEQLLDLVHVADVISAMAVAIERLAMGLVHGHESYAVSSGELVTLRQLVAIIEAATGTIVPVRWGQRPYRKREVMQPWTSGQPLPGWSPRIGLIEGVKGVVASYV